MLSGVTEACTSTAMRLRMAGGTRDGRALMSLSHLIELFEQLAQAQKPRQLEQSERAKLAGVIVAAETDQRVLQD